MFLPETVSADSLKSSLQLAADAHADATVAISLQNRWVAFRGKLAALADGQLYLRFPPPQPEGPKETLTGKTTQIIIKYRDYRFVGSVSLSASTAEGPLADCLCTALPREMKRFEHASTGGSRCPPTARCGRRCASATTSPRRGRGGRST